VSLVPPTSSFTPEWLARQRWFRAKHRPVASIVEADRAPLVGNAWLLILAARYADGGEDRYLVPAIDEGGRWREPRDGDGAWAAIALRMANGAELPAGSGRFRFDATSALPQLLTGGLEERRLEVEQTNTSVILGERLILKIYRQLEAGENPDLEMGRFLTGVGFAATPTLAGAAQFAPADGSAPSAACMLQALVPSGGDGWSQMLALLATDLDASIRATARIGAVTSDLHRALASRPGDPSFPARPATDQELAAWRADAERELVDAIAALSGAQHERLLRLAPSVRASFADAFGSAGGSAQVTRIHGDYHLGQLLVTDDGSFAVIDFEGEPARPLAERRRPASPLRDVAGMLRSLDYVGRTAESGAPAARFSAEAWLVASRAALLAAYDATRLDAELLRAFELQKACYEVRYEASNRPDWTWLPLEALERLSG
jgi:maltokinase